MSQQVSNPPNRQFPPADSRRTEPVKSKGLLILLTLVGILFLLLTGQLLWSLSHVIVRRASSSHGSTPRVTQNDTTGPLLPPGQSTAPQLTLPTGKYVVYQQPKNISIVPLSGGLATVLNAPGYIYSLSTPPLVTPSGQLLYSGNGLWLIDVFANKAQQIAMLPAGQVITSVALSQDGSTVAWSTEPANGEGDNVLYVGPLQKSVPIYQHDATDCPCFRVFSFWQSKGVARNSTLLLTDDQGNHQDVHFGLWSLNTTPLEDPRQMLDEDVSQGPLTISSDGTFLVYSTKQDNVPATNDGSVPSDVAALNYANSLLVASIGISSDGYPQLEAPSTLLPEQHDLSNSAAYHWITTPVLAPDNRTLLYIVFSSDAQSPFDRHSAVYAVHIKETGTQLEISKPQLLANSTDLFVELGTWVNSSVITFYSDGTLYAFADNNAAVAKILTMTAYTRVVTVVQGGTE